MIDRNRFRHRWALRFRWDQRLARQDRIARLARACLLREIAAVASHRERLRRAEVLY